MVMGRVYCIKGRWFESRSELCDLIARLKRERGSTYPTLSLDSLEELYPVAGTIRSTKSYLAVA